MHEIRFLNKRNKLIFSLKWNDPVDLVNWAVEKMGSTFSEYRGTDNVITLETKDKIEPVKFLTEGEKIEAKLKEYCDKPIIDWGRVRRESFFGTGDLCHVHQLQR